MSRIGKLPITFEKPVEVSVTNNVVTVKGAKNAITIPVNESLNVEVKDGAVTLTRKNDETQTRSYHGLYRTLIQNAVIGLTKGWEKRLELNGVGYRASVSGSNLELNLGYSHPVKFTIPKGVEIKVEKQTKVIVTGFDRAQVGQVAADIRNFRKPEPYLGKGVKYEDEYIRRKVGKSAGK